MRQDIATVKNEKKKKKERRGKSKKNLITSLLAYYIITHTKLHSMLYIYTISYS